MHAPGAGAPDYTSYTCHKFSVTLAYYIAHKGPFSSIHVLY